MFKYIVPLIHCSPPPVSSAKSRHWAFPIPIVVLFYFVNGYFSIYNRKILIKLNSALKPLQTNVNGIFFCKIYPPLLGTFVRSK